MRYVLINLLWILCFAVGCSQNIQNKYSIKGKIDESLKVDSVFIYSGSDIIATALVINGSFELHGNIPEPAQVTLYARAKSDDPEGGTRVGRLILENADYTLVYKDNDSKIKGGTLHDLVLGFESSDEYQQAVAAYGDISSAVYNGKEDGYEPTADEKQRMREKMNDAIGIENRELAAVISNATGSTLAKAFALARTQDWDNYPLDKRLTLFDNYAKESKGNQQVIDKLRAVFADMKEAEELQKTVEVGRSFKDIEAEDINGNTIKLSDIVAKNKYTILEFWASWCGPCRGEIPNLKKAYAKYKPKGLEIYSISIDEKQDKWLRALKEEGTTWINVVENLGFKGGATAAYGVRGVPASFLIAQDGKIVAVSEELRGRDLDKTLGKHIN